MRLNRLGTSVLAALLLTAPAAYAQSIPMAKQLAGPAEEFATLRAVDPAESAIYSKSALLPVELQPAKNGSLQGLLTLPLETTSARFLVLSGADAAWSAEVRDGAGRMLPGAQMTKRAGVEPLRFGMAGATTPADRYELMQVTPGEFTLKLSAKPGAPQRGFVLVEGDDRTELASYQTHKRQLVGERIGIAALLTAHDGHDGTLMGADAGTVAKAALRVTAPDGTVSMHPMADDGLNGDGEAGDGVFGGAFEAKQAGQYLAQVVVNGRSREGTALVRTAEHVVPVVERSLALAQTKAIGRGKASDRFTIAIPVTASKKGQHYRAYAEVWGRDADGKDAAIAWVGGMVAPINGRIDLGLDPRWVARSKAAGQFELRNLRIEDPDHFVPVLQAGRLPLSLPAVPKAMRRGKVTIDETMTMGPRPAALAEAATEKGVGSRLLLVHGYCSGDVWPAGNFTNASKFLDLNKNRTHDQFARLIQTFGNTWNSYGIVAHSQGGAASLHLYTYYWSGLDNATGNRLIQSVGTPYQGTNLAGILAALGNWFGVGCGTNDNLTYSGASSWLAGIPTWARSKVNYYTTSFTDVWYRYDYCNMATDVVLSDPEDGTTEKAYGQLSGAVNRGHTTGQCHTTGMRDPAQYQNASRNSTMNSNAAR